MLRKGLYPKFLFLQKDVLALHYLLNPELVVQSGTGELLTVILWLEAGLQTGNLSTASPARAYILNIIVFFFPQRQDNELIILNDVNKINSSV